MKANVWGYGRVSPGGKEVSIERQKIMIDSWWESSTRQREYPDELFYYNPETNWFHDTFVSGVQEFCHEREGIQKILARLQEGDLLVVSFLDRLGRDSVDIQRFVHALQRNNVKFLSLDIPLDFDSASGRHMLSIMAATSAFENERRAERCINGLEKLKSDGARLGVFPPTGWKFAKKKVPNRKAPINILVPDAVSRKLANKIVEIRENERLSWFHVSLRLRKEGVTHVLKSASGRSTRVVEWTDNTVSAWYAQAKKGFPKNRLKSTSQGIKEKRSSVATIVNPKAQTGDRVLQEILQISRKKKRRPVY